MFLQRAHVAGGVMQFFTRNPFSQLPLVVLIGGVVLAGLWLANVVYDFGAPNYVSRKIGHGVGGLAFLGALLFPSPGWPILFAAAFGAVLLGARLVKPTTFRGVGGAGRSDKVMAEVWFAWVAVPVFCISWLWLDRPEVAAACLLFMAWGDGITGFVRWHVYHRAVKGLWGSAAMFVVCLAISLPLVRPFWIGGVGSAVATATEWVAGDIGFVKWLDDNLAVPLTSLGVILGLMALTHNL
jgi:phytol kinase